MKMFVYQSPSYQTDALLRCNVTSESSKTGLKL